MTVLMDSGPHGPQKTYVRVTERPDPARWRPRRRAFDLTVEWYLPERGSDTALYRSKGLALAIAETIGQHAAHGHQPDIRAAYDDVNA